MLPSSPDPPPAPDAHSLADGRLRRLDPAWVTTSRIGGAITMLVIGGGTLAGAIIVIVTMGLPAGALAFAAWIFILLVLAWSAFAYPKLAWKRARYRVSENGIQIRRGVWWRHVIDVPRARIQHTDVDQGPLLRRYGIATLTMHTAGTEFASVQLPGLQRDDALSIRDTLIGGVSAEGLDDVV